ncbi:MAG TPA: lipopolysaccharide heptosyltransferase II [Chthoniobacteraceae bacterium]|nr:lipopolysaccharide heptosyltransferase II [Chthoniobacteraceae bacterium]
MAASAEPAHAPAAEQANVLPARILIRSSNWLGDAVMTAPAVRAIKLTRPDAHITILTRAKLADFWKIVPEVDAVIPCEQKESVFSVAKKIRAGNFDLALIFPNSVRSALEVYLARIPRRAGSHGKYRRWLLTSVFTGRLKPGPPRHQMHHYLDLAEFAGAKVDESMRHIETALNPPPRPAPAGDAKGVKIGLCPGAEYGRAKRWLPERFAEAVNAVSQRRDCEWMLFGTARDVRVGEEIAAHIEGNHSNLIGKTTLAELIAALSECRLLLTNDTGTMHLASYLGVPSVSIFGSTEPKLTGPLGASNRVLRHHVECSPCFLRDCPLDFRCMKAITTDEVVEAVLRMLEV